MRWLPGWRRCGISNRSAFLLSTVIAFATIGISVSFLTGLAGQLSLGQVAFAAIGAVVGVRVAVDTGSLALGLLCGGITGAAASAAVGLPALRMQGLLLAVATLAFALATFSWLLRQDWAFGSGLSSRPVSVLGVEVTNSRGFYYVALAVFAVVLAVAATLRRSSFGRTLVAVRDNEAASRVLQVAPWRLLVSAYAFAGFVAGAGGVVLAMNNTFVTRSIFSPGDSINVVAIAVIGGLSELTGPLLGAAYLIGIREFFDLELSALAGLNAAWLILILEQPRGIHGLLDSTRRNLIDQIARFHGIDPDTAEAPRPDAVASPAPVPAAVPGGSAGAGGTVLEVRGLSRRFGDLKAVDDVSFSVTAGETLGLIGPNGAGKTTVFELVSGYLRPQAGSVVFDGDDITRMSPEARSRRGLVRSFQNASLFPTMTPREIVFLACRSAAGGRFVLGGSRAERAIEDQAGDTLAGIRAGRGGRSAGRPAVHRHPASRRAGRQRGAAAPAAADGRAVGRDRPGRDRGPGRGDRADPRGLRHHPGGDRARHAAAGLRLRPYDRAGGGPDHRRGRPPPRSRPTPQWYAATSAPEAERPAPRSGPYG